MHSTVNPSFLNINFVSKCWYFFSTIHPSIHPPYLSFQQIFSKKLLKLIFVAQMMIDKLKPYKNSEDKTLLVSEFLRWQCEFFKFLTI